MTPAIGRIVHYVAYGTPIRPDGSQAFPSVCRSAIVTEVDPENPDRLGLFVANPTGTFHHPLGLGGCTYSDAEQDRRLGRGLQGGTWHWPERAPEET